MSKPKTLTFAQRLAPLLVDLLGPGPEGDESRLEQARIAAMAWSSAQSSLIGSVRELLWMRDKPTYADERFENWN